jgi:hypothetical protein
VGSCGVATGGWEEVSGALLGINVLVILPVPVMLAQRRVPRRCA